MTKEGWQVFQTYDCKCGMGKKCLIVQRKLEKAKLLDKDYYRTPCSKLRYWRKLSWIYYCQARVPALTYWMAKHLREKLKSHRESQKGTRADAIIQRHPPTTTTTTITLQNWYIGYLLTTSLSIRSNQSIYSDLSRYYNISRYFSLSRHSSMFG